MLEKLLAKLPKGSLVQFSHDITGQGPDFFKAACQRHLEGIISGNAPRPRTDPAVSFEGLREDKPAKDVRLERPR